MRRILFSLFCSLAFFGGPATAQSQPVVVELYTSQGCSSCPPADEYLGALIQRRDVIALALHVDYWDYIGWKDKFADKAFTKRQKAYARSGGRRMIYTPQIIVGGVEHEVGSDIAAVNRLIQAHLGKAPLVKFMVKKRNQEIVVNMENIASPSAAMAVQLVNYTDGETVDIGRGENAGRSIRYHNIVTDWTLLKGWDGQAPLLLRIPNPQSGHAVVIVQDGTSGAIIGAVKLE